VTAGRDQDDDEPYVRRERAGVIASAYVLALLGFLVPLAYVGALFAGVVLLRRGHREHGAAVIALGAVSVTLGIAVLR